MKIGKLIVFPISTIMVLSSCGTRIEKNENIASRSKSATTSIYEEDNNNYLINPDVVSCDDIYDSELYKFSIDYEDLILTEEEKGYDISYSARNLIKEISDHDVLVNSDYIDVLDIDETELLDGKFSNKKMIHTGKVYYVSESDSICWDKLIKTIYSNSVDSEKKKNKDTKVFESLSLEDITIVVNQIRNFTYEVKKRYPSYDLSHLACVLSDLSLLYKVNLEDEDENVFAYTTYSQIVWCVNSDGEYPDLKNLEAINDHEYKHLLCNNCIDEIMGSGYHVDEAGISKFTSYDMSFDFISEATAEEFSADINGRPAVSYNSQRNVLNSIRFVLSISDDYELDSFTKYSFLHDPIAMMQQFPVLENTKSTYKDNFTMLSSLDKLLTYIPYDYVFKIEDTYGYDSIYDDMRYKEIFNSFNIPWEN